MIKVDLSKKRFERTRKVDRYRKIVQVVTILLVFLFLGQIAWMVGKLVIGGFEYDSLKRRSDLLQGDLIKKTDDISDYFRMKESLKQVEKLDKERFRYKEYLSYVNNLLPEGSILTNVDFVTKDTISFSVRFIDSNLYKLFELEMNNEGWRQSEIGVVAFTQDSLVRSEDGSYSVKLLVRIKNG